MVSVHGNPGDKFMGDGVPGFDGDSDNHPRNKRTRRKKVSGPNFARDTLPPSIISKAFGELVAERVLNRWRLEKALVQAEQDSSSDPFCPHRTPGVGLFHAEGAQSTPRKGH